MIREYRVVVPGNVQVFAAEIALAGRERGKKLGQHARKGFAPIGGIAAVSMDEAGEFFFQTPLLGTKVVGDFLARNQTDVSEDASAARAVFGQLLPVSIHQGIPDPGRQFVHELRVRSRFTQMDADGRAERLVAFAVEFFPGGHFAADATRDQTGVLGQGPRVQGLGALAIVREVFIPRGLRIEPLF